MNIYKVSIIVPIYNCENDLKRCLDSLVCQTLSNCEIILVNDGSTDNSGAICQSYQEKHGNICYIAQENGGVSAARNAGLRAAQGEYVMFLDADDYYEPNAAEVLYEKAVATRADVVLGGMHKNICGEDQFVSCGDFEATGAEVSNVIVQMAHNFTLNSVCVKLYQKNLLLENLLFFNLSLSSGEDLDWMCRLFLHVQSVAGISTILYHYIVDNAQSLSQKFLPNYFDQIQSSFDSLKALYAAQNLPKEEQEWLLFYHAHRIWGGFSQITQTNCPLSFSKKVSYIHSGLTSACFQEYRQWGKPYLPWIKSLILRLRPAVIITIALLVAGKLCQR